ncbi:MAG: hypothetical protein K6G33_11980 [Ruminococcus sp.]|uniref:hypothetical protein n=1 Tax=Ruminococcus sp. TaxID=41978 RepID=UPI0025F56601|nr:hypothetical protein [Ruminococcus sp.]MCR5601445.1 hypothetical protein [Ruminococcus sp.]
MMKRIAAFIVAAAAAGCVFTGCQPKKKEIKSEKITQQESASYEDALKECFKAMQYEGGGEIFYSYMYPNETIEAMKKNGEYDKLVKSFNESQSDVLKSRDVKYEFSGIKTSKELSEKQVAGVKKYLVELSEPYLSTLTEDRLDVKEGYETTYEYLKDNKTTAIETVIVFKLNDEGWKVITQ